MKPLFDPSKPDKELFDTLAETQADHVGRVGSSQLRRFFGEVKDLYRRYKSLTASRTDEETREVYEREIEPLFKMIRSKAMYARRRGGQGRIPAEFADFLDEGIRRVGNHKDFERFVRHFEAVVGFMYGKDKVAS